MQLKKIFGFILMAFVIGIGTAFILMFIPATAKLIVYMITCVTGQIAPEIDIWVLFDKFWGMYAILTVGVLLSLLLDKRIHNRHKQEK